MMAERDLCRAFFHSDVVENAASKPAAKRAKRLALGNVLLNYRICILLYNSVGHIDRLEIFRQHVLGKAGLLLIEGNRKDVKLYRCSATDVEQQIEKRIAVLSARQADHYAVALIDHRKVGDGTAHLFEQSGFCLCLSEQYVYP